MSKPLQEADVFKSIQAGNKKVFDDFFIRHYAALCGYADQFVGFSEGEEIVQDVMVWLWENRENIVIEATLIKYLFRAVKNKCINHIHKSRLKGRVFESLSAQQDKLMNDPDFYIVEELTQKIEEALTGLPDTYREAFILSRIDGKTYQEIATLLNVSSKTVDYRIQQSLKILRIKLKDYLPVLMTLFYPVLDKF